MAIAEYQPSLQAKKNALHWAQVLTGISADKKVFNLTILLLGLDAITMAIPFIRPSSLIISAIIWGSGSLVFVVALLVIHSYYKVHQLESKLPLLFDKGLRLFAETYKASVICKNQILKILKGSDIQKIFELCGALYTPKLESLLQVFVFKEKTANAVFFKKAKYRIVDRSNQWGITVEEIAQLLFPKYLEARETDFSKVDSSEKLKALLIPREVFQPRMKEVFARHPNCEFYYVKS